MKRIWIFYSVVILIIGVLLTHNNYLIEISDLETKIIEQKRENEELNKVLLKKRSEYNKVVDLKKLEMEMKKKKNMEISNEVVYFKIGGGI